MQRGLPAAPARTGSGRAPGRMTGAAAIAAALPRARRTRAIRDLGGTVRPATAAASRRPTPGPTR
jgi:hypothetical protein